MDPTSANSRFLWDNLPVDQTGALLFSRFKANELLQIGRVNRKFRTLCNLHFLWKKLIEEKYPEIGPIAIQDFKKYYLDIKRDSLRLNAQLRDRLTQFPDSESTPVNMVAFLSDLLQETPLATRVSFESTDNGKYWRWLDSQAIKMLGARTHPLLALEIKASLPDQHAEIDDEALLKVAEGHPELRSLYLEGCCVLTEETFLKALHSFPKLRHLSIDNGNLLTHEVALKISTLEHLRSLKLYGINHDITEDDLSLIRTNCVHLRSEKITFVPYP